MLLAVTSSLSVRIHLACASFLFLGCPGILARVSRRLSALVTLSLSTAHSRLLVSPLASPSTPLGCSLDFPSALHRLFFDFRLFFWAYQLVLLFRLCGFLHSVFMILMLFIPLSVSFADPDDRMRIWLFFLYLCQHIIRLPLSVQIMIALSSMYVVSQACHGLPSCCYSLAGSFESLFTYAPQSHHLYLSFHLGL